LKQEKFCLNTKGGLTDWCFIYIMGEAKAFISETFSDGKWSSTYIHEKSLREVVQNFSPKEFFTLISLAANAIHNVNNSATSLEYKEALDKEVKSYTQALEAEKKCLQDKLERATKFTHDEKERITEKFSEEIKLLRSSNKISEDALLQMKRQYTDLVEQAKNTYVETLEKLSKDKDAQREKEISRIVVAHQKTIDDLKESTRERVTQCDNQYKDTITHLKASYADQEARLKKELEKSYASSEKGKQGEMLFEDVANQYTKWGPLENTSKISHGADRSCKIRGCDTLIEVKNYTHDVPSKEVTKFYRDMEEHPDYPLGIFVSQKTNIDSKKSGNFILSEWTANSQLLVFINSFNSHAPEDVLNFIDMCADIALKVFKMSHERPEDSDNTMLLQGKIDMVKPIVQKELKAIAEFHNAVNVQKTSLIQSVTKYHTENSLAIKHRKESLKEILAILLGEEEETPEIVESVKVPKARTKKPASN